MLAFFQNARVYENVSTIVHLEIQSYYPPLIKKNILLSGLADKLVDTIVTPDTVANVAAPALRLSVKFAQAPTSIINNKVVISTALYKQQVVQALTNFGLPKFVVVNAKLVIDAVPAQLTLVNLEKRPNSILGIIIKIRTFLQYNQAALQISWMVLVALIIIIFLDTIHRFRDFFKAIWISFAVSGLLVITLYFARNLIMSIFLPSSSDPLMVAQNALVTDAVSYLLREIRNIGVIYVVFAVISFVIWRFVNFVKLQIKINKVLRRLNIHIPTVTVKVK
ncbi:MAG: hypothetical protein KBD46_02985 [Candidatus Levybacteria bacterium]|nr:hypothetical protein [Candidatus Levybacteria bacterium]